MNDAEYEAQTARVMALHKKWIQPLGLNPWRVDHTFVREGIPTGDAALDADNWQVNAQVRIQWPYQHVAIQWSCPAIAVLDDDDLERSFVHELCHALVNEMREWHDHPPEIAIDHEERVVSMLTSAFLWTRDAGAKDEG